MERWLTIGFCVLCTTAGCGDDGGGDDTTDASPAADAAGSLDASPGGPVPGDSGNLTVSSDYCHGATVSWTAASDDSTPAAQLSYRVYYSESSAMTTVAEVDSNGTPAGDATTDITTRRISGLTIDTTYYVNVIVSDGDGNRAVYAPVTVTTDAPFERVADINAGSFNSGPADLTVFGGKLYFTAFTGTNGRELWVYDGSNPPELVVDIRPGDNGSTPYSSDPGQLTVFNDKLYFSADDGTNGRRLWVYDGSANPTVGNNVVMVGTVTEPGGFTEYMGRLYFAATSTDGVELWWVDTAGSLGHENIATTTCPAAGCSSNPTSLAVYDGALFFGADAGAVGKELYRKLGTGATGLGIDIYPGECSAGVQCDSIPQFLTVYADELYMQATGPGGGREVWVYNGSAVTKPFDLNDGGQTRPTDFILFADRLLFNADDSGSVRHLWAYDGSNMPVQVHPEQMSSPAVFANQLYFAASGQWDGNFVGSELWVYDGANPPELVCEMVPGSGGGNPSELVEFGGTLYFAASGGDGAGVELWRLVP